MIIYSSAQSSIPILQTGLAAYVKYQKKKKMLDEGKEEGQEEEEKAGRKNKKYKRRKRTTTKKCTVFGLDLLIRKVLL
jgi:hypothetical protein